MLSSLCGGAREYGCALGVHDHDLRARDVLDGYEANDRDGLHERGRALGASAPSDRAQRVSGHGEHDRRPSYR